MECGDIMNASNEVFPRISDGLFGIRPPEGVGGSQLAAGDGIVWLVGRVVSEMDRQMIAQLIGRSGSHIYVERVDVVGEAAREAAADTRTVATVGAALLPHLCPADDYVRLRVEDGWAELDGEVQDFSLRETLGRIVRELEGITGLTNCLDVRSDVSVDQLKQQVAEALERVTPVASLP
jgi:hypothetical protein